MEAPVEHRLRSVEERLQTLESLLGVAAPAPAPIAPPTAQPTAQPAAPPRPRREPLDLEELLGGRVLGWVGGAAVVLAAVFFLAMAIHDGWIDEPTRVVLAFLASAALTAAGVRLHERKGRTQAARAAAAAGIAAFYASDTAATALYHLVPAAAGLAVAGAVGAVATALAVRWSSQELAGIGLVGALLAPVLVRAATTGASLVFMAVALCAAVGVLVWRRWSWLGVTAFVVGVPQAAAWLDDERRTHLVPALVVLGALWALYVVAALGYELRDRTAKLRVSSTSLLFANASLSALGGWAMLHAAGDDLGATVWVLAAAVAHAALGAAVRGRVNGEVGALLVAVGSALAAVGLALALDGPALVAGWSAEAVLLACAARRTGDRRGAVGAAGFLTAAAAHVLLFEAQPKALAYGLPSPGHAVVAAALVLGACVAVAALLDGRARRLLVLAACVGAVYIGSCVVVDLAGASGHVTQDSQLALSAFGGLLGFAGLLAGLRRDRGPLRHGGLALLGLAVGKVFVVDLAALGSLWRVASFFVLGLLLLAAAFAYQRMRRPGATA